MTSGAKSNRLLGLMPQSRDCLGQKLRNTAWGKISLKPPRKEQIRRCLGYPVGEEE